MSFKNFSRMIVAALCGSVLLTGCGRIDTDATLVTITNGDTTDTITLGYGNFVARYNQALYDMYYGDYMGADMWTEDLTGSGSSMQEETKSSVLEEMETWYVSKLHADTYDVSISDEDQTAIDEAAAAFISANSGKAIEQIGATEEYVKQLLTDRTYATRVQAAIEQEAEGEVEVTDAEAKQSTFSYYEFDKETEDSDSEDESSDSESVNQESLANAKKVAEAENFDKAGDDVDAEIATYSFTTAADPEDDGTMDAAVITAAKSLAKDQVSDVIETDDAYYVIRLDKKYDKDATETKRQELLDEKVSAYYDDIVEDWKSEITWTVDDKAWEKVTFDERFKNGAPAAE